MRNGGEKKEKREKRSQKMKETDPFPFYVGLQTGSVHIRPTLACYQSLDLDPNGSGSPERLWGVGLIRIP